MLNCIDRFLSYSFSKSFQIFVRRNANKLCSLQSAQHTTVVLHLRNCTLQTFIIQKMNRAMAAAFVLLCIEEEKNNELRRNDIHTRHTRHSKQSEL